MSETKEKEEKEKIRRITIIDKDGRISKMLEDLTERLGKAQSVVILNDTTLIRALIVSATNKFKKGLPEKIDLENLFS